MQHFIYVLFDENNKIFYSNKLQKNCKKIGSTCDIDSRLRNYQTIYCDKVPLFCYYQILNPEKYSCYQIDNMIKQNFDDFRLKSDGGIEFYFEEVTTNNLEMFFEEQNIQFKKLYDYDKKKQINYQNIIFDDQQKQRSEKIKQKSEKIQTRKSKSEKIETKKQKSEEIIKSEKIETKKQKSEEIKINKNEEIKTNKKEEIKLFDDQVETLEKITNYFKDNDKGILNLFCRMGKTIISAYFCKQQNYKKILILVPSLQLINQTKEKWSLLFDEEQFICICCEEKKKITDFYNDNKQQIIISTYQSSDQLLDYYFDICIFDEAHRTSGYRDSKSNFKILLQNEKIKKKLFMTATLKQYNDIDECYTMDDKEVYGEIIHHVSAKKAKELKRISDYKIVTIEIDQQNYEQKQDKYTSIANALKQSVKKYNLKHIITYHQKVENAKLFSKILNDIGLESFYIDGTMSKKQREQIINQFQQKQSVLCSCKTMQEGVDIPNCDSVLFVDMKSSVIDTIQSLSRCLTYQQNKTSYILIPYNKQIDILNDKYTNNLRLMLRNIIEIDDNLREYFLKKLESTQIQKIEDQQKNNKQIDEEFGFFINMQIIENISDICYQTFQKAKELINNKYLCKKDYQDNVKIDFQNQLPIDADKVYKKFGWTNWFDYLNIEKKQTANQISRIIKKENDKRFKKNQNLIILRDELDLYLQENDIDKVLIPNENWIEFVLSEKIISHFQKQYFTIQELKQFIVQENIDSEKKYEEVSHPRLINKDFINQGFYSKQGVKIIQELFDSVGFKKKRCF